MDSADKGAKLDEEGLFDCLALFPVLAFDWKSPVASGSSSSFNHEDATVLFSRLDVDSDGWVTAADLRAWQQMLPLGRSEDDLVRSFFVATAGADASFATAAAADQALPSLNLSDFFTVLQHDPMLAAEMSTQVAVLDFSAGGGQQDENKKGKSKLFSKSSGTKEAVLPSDSMTKAFVCVAKLKLCQLVNVYSEVYAQEDSVAAFMLFALGTNNRSQISARDIQEYLHGHANLTTLSLDNVHCLLDDALHHEEGKCDTNKVVQSVTCEITEGDDESGLLLNKEALRQVCSRPALRKFATLWHRFVQVQQKDASGQPQESMALVPTIQDGNKPDLLRRFEPEAFESWFKELDEDLDGFVAPRDLILWCATATCQGLVDETDLESLFESASPNSNDQQNLAAANEVESAPPQASDLTPAPHVVIDFGQEVAMDDFIGVFEGPDDEGDVEAPAPEQQTKASADMAVVSPLRAVGLAANRPVPTDGLTEKALADALERRPLLAAQLELMYRYNCVKQATQLVEASAKTALNASETVADTAADKSDWKRAQVLGEAAISAAKRAGISAKSAWGETNQRSFFCKRAAIAQELEASLNEAEVNDPRSASTRAARRALHELILTGARRNLSLRLIEVALELKLMAWWEAGRYHFVEPVVKEETVVLQEKGRAVEKSAAAAAQESRVKKRVAFARQPSSMDTASNDALAAGSREHFDRMAHTFDEEDQGQTEDEGKNDEKDEDNDVLEAVVVSKDIESSGNSGGRSSARKTISL